MPPVPGNQACLTIKDAYGRLAAVIFVTSTVQKTQEMAEEPSIFISQQKIQGGKKC
jgi:hypothetical protein